MSEHWHRINIGHRIVRWQWRRPSWPRWKRQRGVWTAQVGPVVATGRKRHSDPETAITKEER